jgi:predicted NBD/HSP70 family sugar kinase
VNRSGRFERPEPSGGGSLESLRDANRERVIDALRTAGTATRGDLAEVTGLSRATISSLITDLQERGMIAELAGQGERSNGTRGRRPNAVRLTPSLGIAVALDFGHNDLHLAIGDLSSTVLVERHVWLDLDGLADDALHVARLLVDEALAETSFTRADVVGAVAGIPGPINAMTGYSGSRAILPAWADRDLPALLSERLALRVRVDNDANLGAIGEHAHGAGRGVDDLIYVKASAGIGAGLILGGRLHRGATGTAGEIGHVWTRGDGDVCRCGNRGCLETVASAPALLTALRSVHGPDLSLADMLALARRGDPAISRVLMDAGRAIGRAVGNLCNSINPAAIVVGGELSEAGPALLAGIREAVDFYAEPGVAAAIRVVAGGLGARAGVLGALSSVVTEGLHSVATP